MEPTEWLREQVDERLEGLFSEISELVIKTFNDLLTCAETDEEIEELLLEALETGIEHGNDETMGLIWICVLLGEMRCIGAIGPLQQALLVPDEDLVGGAIRALRRIGEPALEAVLEQVEDESVSAECYAACVSTLEGVRLHDLPDLLDGIEHMLIRHVLSVSERLKNQDPDPMDPERILGIRHLESAALTLARLGSLGRLGSQRTREPIEAALKLLDGSNSFLLEALDIMEEQPEGIPCTSGGEWTEEYRWALGGDLPGGDLQEPDLDELTESEPPHFDTHEDTHEPRL